MKQRRKNGQSTGCEMRRCKIWRISLRKRCQGIRSVTWKRYRACTKQKTGVGCDCFHPKVRLDATQETRGVIVEFLENVEQSGKWPQHARTTTFFLIPKNVTSERPIALMPTLIRWWEALRAPEVAKWQQKYRVDWDATSGRNGGAQQTVWELLIEMERLNTE